MSEELSKGVSKRLSILLSLKLVKLYEHAPPKLFCCIWLKLVNCFFSQDGSEHTFKCFVPFINQNMF